MKKYILFSVIQLGILFLMSHLAEAVDCNDDAMIRACPKTCLEKCEKTDFFLDHWDACKEIMEKDASEGFVEDDPSLCGKGASVPGEGGALPMDCSNNSYIVDNPERCMEKCRDKDFFTKHKTACEKILNSPKPPPVMGVSEVQRLKDCLEFQRSIEREFPDDDERLTEAEQKTAEFISTMPECAANTTALRGMYECLLEEAKAIKSSFDSLEEKGYLNVNNPEVVCQYKKGQIKSDIAFAGKVRQSATQLIDEFANVSDCHNKYKDWLKAKELESTGSPSMAAITQSLLDAIQRSLEPVTEQKSKVNNILSLAQENQKAIQTVLNFYYVIGCPQKD
jgi:hypothetical protein